MLDPLPISPSPAAGHNFEDPLPSSPGIDNDVFSAASFSNETGTDPAFKEPTQMPQADPRAEHLGIQSWMELPLPSPKNPSRESPVTPTQSATPDRNEPNRLERLVEIMREDPFVAFMGAGIVLILLLLITVFVFG